MNIIILNDYGVVQGGATQVAISSARGLAEAGYNVTYIFGTGEKDDALLHPNISIVDLGQYDLLSNPSRLNAAYTGIWNKDVQLKVDDILSEFDPQNTIVHLHSWVKVLSASVVSVVLNRQFPFVLTLHDYFSACPNGGFYNYQQQSICKLKPMSLACLTSNCDMRSYSQKIWRYCRQLFYPHAGIPDGIKNFISVSKFSEDILRPYLPRNANLQYVPNPIDITLDKVSNPSQSEYFSYVGRFSAEKGALLFAQATNLLNVSARFVGAGDLEDSLKEANNKAEFTGWVSRPEIVNYIKDSRAIIFPSEWYETQGMVVAEAAALGVPSIISDSCAARDFVVDGETGLLFEAGNVESLKDKIQLLAENPDLAREMGSRAYQEYWDNPNNMEKHLACLLEYYRTVLNHSKSGC